MFKSFTNFASVPEAIIIHPPGALSACGAGPEAAFAASLSNHSCIRTLDLPDGTSVPAALLHPDAASILDSLKSESHTYKRMDPSVLMAIATARMAVKYAGWTSPENAGVMIGSSRGATQALEHALDDFQSGKRLSPFTSPLTTLGSISSMVAADLGAAGPAFSHSMTCSTAIFAIANGIAWLRSGFASRVLAGGSEAAATPFTIEMFRSMRLYAEHDTSGFPCRPFGGLNSMVLGEGTAIFGLESVDSAELKPGDMTVAGMGWGREPADSSTGISTQGVSYRKAIEMALETASIDAPDVIIAHAPGTNLGDEAEANAIKTVFGTKTPVIVAPKWCFGHTLGASAALSMAIGMEILKTQKVPAHPAQAAVANKYRAFFDVHPPEKIKTVLVLSSGFGNQSAALLLRIL